MSQRSSVIESLMAKLADELAKSSGASYATVRYEKNAQSDIDHKWDCYTPAGGWTDGKSWEEARDKQLSTEHRLEELRERARRANEAVSEMEARLR